MTLGLSLGLKRRALLVSGEFDILDAFNGGRQGALYDAMDLSTFFNDVAMTSQANINSFVLAQADKSPNGNHRLQPSPINAPFLRGTPVGGNIMVNGTFDDATGWTEGSGWSIGSGVATAAAATAVMPSSFVPVSGRVYLVIFTVLTRTAGSIGITLGGQTPSGYSVAGLHHYYITTGSTAVLGLNAVGFSGTVDNVRVYDVSADAVQAPYALVFDGSDDFMSVGGIDLTATDKLMACMGRGQYTTTSGNALEFSVNAQTTNGAFAMTVGSGGRSQALLRGNTTFAGIIGAIPAFPNAIPRNVATILCDIAGATRETEGVQRTNGAVDVASYVGTADNEGGNFGTYALYFGSRAGTTLHCAYHDYGGIIRAGSLPNATLLANIEAWAEARIPILP